jgi:hypothetical protein
VRVYLPATVPLLRDWIAAGAATPVGAAFAVTPSLREWYRDGDGEELEHAASSLAAAAALELLAGHPDAPPRRVVLAVDVSDGECTPDAGRRGALRLAAAVPRSQWASALIDDESASAVVLGAVASLRDSTTTSDDVAFALGEVEDAELGWYAVQELSFVLAGHD